MFYIDSCTMRPNHEFANDVIKDAMERGVRLDLVKIREIMDALTIGSNNCMMELRKKYGIANPNSSMQVKDAFMRVIKEEDLKHCKVMGKITFKKEVLVKLAEIGYDLAKDMLEYRKAKKTLESMTSLLEHCDLNGIVHPIVERGATNRFNYSKPALMNIPKALLWDVIIPYKDGNKLYSVDIKQQEPWLLVNMLEIEELQELIAEHKDFYKALYFAAFREECTDEQRSEVKRAWNAMSYGASEPGILQYCTTFDGKVLYKYFNSIPEYKQYAGRAYGLAKKNVQRMQTLFGTELYAEEYGPKLRRVLMNIPIQGTGSDILAFLIDNFCDTVNRDGYSDIMQIYYTRHDELIIEADSKFSEESMVKYLKDIFEHQIDYWEPFNVEISRVSAMNLDDIGDDTDE